MLCNAGWGCAAHRLRREAWSRVFGVGKGWPSGECCGPARGCRGRGALQLGGVMPCTGTARMMSKAVREWAGRQLVDDGDRSGQRWTTEALRSVVVRLVVHVQQGMALSGPRFPIGSNIPDSLHVNHALIIHCPYLATKPSFCTCYTHSQPVCYSICLHSCAGLRRAYSLARRWLGHLAAGSASPHATS